MRVVVIGGTGHIGTFLVPRLVEAGHEVVNVSRGQRATYAVHDAWAEVRPVVADREAEDRAGTFGATIAALDADAVVDLVCFTAASAGALVEALRGRAGHLLSCGSVWRYGPSHSLPIREGGGTPAVGEYGVDKTEIAQLLLEETRSGGLDTTSLHPGHISGPGWRPIGPLGNLDDGVWWRLSAGETLEVPGLGAEFMHHVHADDVAQAFQRAIARREVAAGQEYNVVAPTAINVRGLATLAAGWFGREATLESVSWERFRATTSADDAGASWEHLSRSQYLSIDKARADLGYEPAYEPQDAVLEAVRWLIEAGELRVASPLVV